jgi:pSer/pThr/pTyr-binding forkhead associated (FHA) protein
MEDDPLGQTIPGNRKHDTPQMNQAKLKFLQPRLVMATRERRAVFEISNLVVVVGRHPQSDVVIEDGMVSKKHSEISFRGGIFYVRDLNSENGTFLDGSAVAGPAEQLQSNQTVRFGTVECLFLTRPLEGTEAQEEQSAQRVAHWLVKRRDVARSLMEKLQAMARSGGRPLAEILVKEGAIEPGIWSKYYAKAEFFENLDPDPPPGPPRYVRWLLLLALVAAAAWAGVHWWLRR